MLLHCLLGHMFRADEALVTSFSFPPLLRNFGEDEGVREDAGAVAASESRRGRWRGVEVFRDRSCTDRRRNEVPSRKAASARPSRLRRVAGPATRTDAARGVTVSP